MSGSDTKADLITAAAVCVRRHGLESTTSRLIAAEAGANLGAITYHFGSKDLLIAKALFGELERRLAPALIILAGADPPSTRLLQAVQQLATDFRRYEDDSLVYLNALMASARGGPLGEQVDSLLGSVHDHLKEAIDALVDSGSVADWVEPEAMASLLMATANGIVMQLLVAPDQSSFDQMTNQLANMLLALTKPGS